MNGSFQGKQDTLRSVVSNSRIYVSSFIEVLFNFRKCLRSVSFPRIVVSALNGLVLYLCQDLTVE